MSRDDPQGGAATPPSWDRAQAEGWPGPDGSGFYAVLLDPEEGTVLWKSSAALVTETQALAVARQVRRHRLKRQGLVPVRSTDRKVETVHLPEDGPQRPPEPLLPVPPVSPEPPKLQAPERPFDGDWSRQVPGAETPLDDLGSFQAVLHDPGAPFTVRWRCAHRHPDWQLAEACALAHRRSLPQGWSVQSRNPLPEPDTVHVTPDAGVRVVVKAHAGSRVSTRCENGALVVEILPPEGDSEQEK